MKKTFIAVGSSALIVFSSVQLANAAEHHHGKVHHRAYSEFRDSNTSAAPLFGSEAYGSATYGSAAEPEWYRYSDGYSDMAGH